MSSSADRNRIRRQNGEIIIKIICTLEKPSLQNIVNQICSDMEIEDAVTIQNIVGLWFDFLVHLIFIQSIARSRDSSIVHTTWDF
jgi:hypothetical protein